jgi:hypothetical protein
MANSEKQDLLLKALQGKASTSEELTVSEESLPSGLIPRATDVFFGPLLGTSGDVRFLGNVDDYSLYSQSSPTSHPQRHRRLVQQKEIYGAKVLAEGTSGTLTDGSTTFASGIADLSYLNAPPLNASYALSDLRLVVSNVADQGEDVSELMGTYGIVGVAGSSLTLDRSFSSSVSPLTEVYWQVIVPEPVELFAWPGADHTAVTTYACTLPHEWPALRVDDASLSLTGAVIGTDAEGRLTMTVDSPGFAVFTEGTWADLDGQSYLVVEHVQTGLAPTKEIMTLTPFYGAQEIDSNNPPSDIYRMYTVGDLVQFPYNYRAELGGQTTWDANNRQTLEALRVRNLISPAQLPPVQRHALHTVFLQEDDAATVRPGYGLTLYPATATGIPDFSNPVTDLGSVVIDPAIETPQDIVVDYTEGLIRLSCPISATGGDLNPNAYTDSQGRTKLFAVYVAHSGSNSPEAVQALSAYAGGLATSKRGNTEIRVQASPTGLRTQLPGAADLYETQARHEAHEIRPASIFGGGTGVTQHHLYRSEHSRRTKESALFSGQPFSDDRRQGIFLRPDAQENGAQRLDLRIVEGPKSVTSALVSTWSPITALTNTLILTVNDVPFEVTLANGVTDAVTVATEIQNAYNTAESALGLSVQSFVAEAYTNSSGDAVRLSSTGELYFGFGSGHANLGFPEDTVVFSESLVQEYGWNNLPSRQTTYNHFTKVVSSNYDDHRLNTPDHTSSLKSAAITLQLSQESYVIDGGDMTDTDLNEVTVTEVTVKHKNYDALDGQEISVIPGAVFDFTGLPTGTYYIYADFNPLDTNDAPKLSAVARATAGFDPFFDSAVNRGVPLHIVDWDNFGVSPLLFRDVRRYLTNEQDRSVVTVGARGMYRTLKGACGFVSERSRNGATNPLDGAFTIRLLEDITLDKSVDTVRVDIPSNTILDLASHQIECLNYNTASISPFRLGINLDATEGDSLPGENITIKNGTIVLDAFGTQAASTAPNLFESVTSAGANRIRFEDLVIASNEDIDTFVEIESVVSFERCTFTSLAMRRLVEFKGINNDFRVRDCFMLGNNKVAGGSAFIDVLNRGARISMVDSQIGLFGNLSLLSDGDAGTSNTAMTVEIHQCVLQGGTKNIIQARSTAVDPLRLHMADTMVTFDNAYALAADLGGSMEGVIMFYSGCEFVDSLDSTANNPQLQVGDKGRVTFTSCLANNFVMTGLGSSGDTTFKVSNCEFVAGLTPQQIANSESGGGSFCEIQIDAGRLYMDGCRFAGIIRVLSSDAAGSNAQISNSFLTGATGFSRIIQQEGGFVRISNSFLSMLVGGATEAIFIAEAGTGVNQNPQTLVTGTQIIHTSGAGVRINGIMDAVILTGNFYRGFGTADAAVEVNDQGSLAQANTQISGGVMEGYPLATTVSDAVIIGDNILRVQIANLLVRSASGATDMNVSGTGTSDIFTETSVRFVN